MPLDDVPRVKLKRLKIDRYRTLRPGTELHFADGVNVILGKNGTGKTTLLYLLGMIVRGNFHPAREEEFAVEFDFGYVKEPDVWSIRLSNERRAARRKTKELQPLQTSLEILYRANGSRDHHDFTITTKENSLIVQELETQKSHSFHLDVFEPFNEHNQNFINSMTLVLEDFTDVGIFAGYELPENIYRLDEARDWLDDLLESDSSFIAFEPEGTFAAQYRTLFPKDMIRAFTDAFVGNRQSVSLVSDSATIPSLQRIIKALDYEGGQVVLEQISADKEQVSFGNLRFHFTKHDGTSVRLDQLSFGEQRLFAFYYYLSCTSQMMIADELTNGLHHEMVSDCISAIGGRQAFLATQNPLLLDHLQFNSPEEVRASFILCTKETIDGQEWMAMRQMAEGEAREFFGHYQVELKQVNAILRWLGLW